MREHMFASEIDGALYDTRAANWSKARPLRPVYIHTFAKIETTAQLRATLRAGAYAWPGGDPLLFVTADGAALSFDSVRENLREVLSAIARNDRLGGWRVEACTINYEDPDLVCDHSGERIESAYSEEEIE